MAYSFDFYRNQNKEVQISSPDSEVAHRAVEIAMLRAHRLYDTITQKEAYEYARSILC